MQILLRPDHIYAESFGRISTHSEFRCHIPPQPVIHVGFLTAGVRQIVTVPAAEERLGWRKVEFGDTPLAHMATV